MSSVSVSSFFDDRNYKQTKLLISYLYVYLLIHVYNWWFRVNKLLPTQFNRCLLLPEYSIKQKYGLVIFMCMCKEYNGWDTVDTKWYLLLNMILCYTTISEKGRGIVSIRRVPITW